MASLIIFEECQKIPHQIRQPSVQGHTILRCQKSLQSIRFQMRAQPTNAGVLRVWLAIGSAQRVTLPRPADLILEI